LPGDYVPQALEQSGRIGRSRSGRASDLGQSRISIGYESRSLAGWMYQPYHRLEDGKRLPVGGPARSRNYLRYDKFGTAFLGFLSDLDWQSLAGEAESPEVKATQAELETVLAEIDRCSGRLAKLQALVSEGKFLGCAIRRYRLQGGSAGRMYRKTPIVPCKPGYGPQPGDGIGESRRPPRDYPFRRSRNAAKA
jgi:hypothetical protein